ncbi:unnamed protein product [Rhizophagus irregularis]|nr:unnamed protein product [Rhizophagus irregularis]
MTSIYPLGDIGDTGLDNIAVKEIIRELKNQREVDYHDNIIRCHGITKFESTEYHGLSIVTCILVIY